MSKQIIWGGTKEALNEGRKILPGAIHSDLRFFDATTAESASVVAVLRGHPKSEACIKLYESRGVRVCPFDLPTPASTKNKKSD